MERNREKRVQVAMTSTLSMGDFFFEGKVENVSRTGVKMSDIPLRFDLCGGECKTIIMGQGRNFKLKVQPCWFHDDGLYKEVGFKIISPTIDWALFMDELVPRSTDIWGSTH